MIIESQNVFKNPDGSLIARRIDLDEIMPTIQWLESVTGLDFSNEVDEHGVPVKWLGTTGRKSSSGDLDLSVDQREITKEQLKQRLTDWAVQSGVPPDQVMNSKTQRGNYIQLAGDNVHFKAPIMGNPELGFVQTDFMFTDNPAWQQFSMRGEGEGSSYKGMHRHILLASIARARGLKYSYKNALVDPVSGQTLEWNPKKIAVALLGSGAQPSDIASVDSILRKIRTNPDYQNLVAAARETLEREGVMLPESLQRGSAPWFRYLVDSLER